MVIHMQTSSTARAVADHHSTAYHSLELALYSQVSLIVLVTVSCCGMNCFIISYGALRLILAICPAAKTMTKSVVLRMRNSSTGSNRRKLYRPGSGPLHVNMVSDPASVLRLHLTDCFVLLSHVKEVL